MPGVEHFSHFHTDKAAANDDSAFKSRRTVSKVRVYELAKELGVESKAVVAKLQEMGEFVRSASSTIEAPVVKKLKEAFPAPAAGAARRPGPGNSRR